jgi:catechol 2,3-dioxygenase-like lactoylglutathione lyase family enzyme
MPAKGSGIHHLDLAVADAEQSIAFYLDLLGPVGWTVTDRFPSYRENRRGHLPRV